MYDSDLFKNAKNCLENCLGVRQVFSALPAGTEISINLDKRIPCALTCHEQHLELAPREAQNADLEFILFTESIRRLNEAAPDNLMILTKELMSLGLAGHVRVHLLSSPKEFYSKGYLTALQGIGPELQKDLSKYAFVLIGQATQAFETIKTLLKR